MIDATSLIVLLCLSAINSYPFSEPPPKAVEAYQQGRVALNCGQFAKATEALSLAIKLAPQWTAPYYSRVIAWHKRKEFAKAIKESTKNVKA